MNVATGERRGNGVAQSDSRSKDPRFEPRHEHKNKIETFSPSQKCRAASLLGVPNPPVWIRTHKNDQVRI